MTIIVKRIHVTAIIEHWCYRGGMNAFDVINLGVGFHRNLPVAIENEAMPRGKAAFVKLELRPFVGNGAKPFQKRGCVFIEIEKDQISRGMVLCKPGSVTPHSKFKAEVYILKKEEGGRHTPFHNNYRPQFYVRTTDVTGNINLPDGVEMVMPGDNVTITVDLIQPIALNLGLRFAIREGGRTVGAGQVTEIID